MIHNSINTSHKQEIVSALEKEKEQFLDEIMILGVKDETIKEKLKKLLEI